MRITTKGRYAIRAVIHLAKITDSKPVPIKVIAAEEKISPEFLEQIFFRLKNNGLVRSVRGPGGGFFLNKEAEEISVKDIFEAVGEGIDLTPCTSCDATEAENCNHREDCTVTPLWKDVSRHVRDYFDSIKLSDVVTKVDNPDSPIAPLLQGQAVDV